MVKGKLRKSVFIFPTYCFTGWIAAWYVLQEEYYLGLAKSFGQILFSSVTFALATFTGQFLIGMDLEFRLSECRVLNPRKCHKLMWLSTLSLCLIQIFIGYSFSFPPNGIENIPKAIWKENILLVTLISLYNIASLKILYGKSSVREGKFVVLSETSGYPGRIDAPIPLPEMHPVFYIIEESGDNSIYQPLKHLRS